MGSLSNNRLDLDSYLSYNFSGDYTADTWYSTSITRPDLNQGLVAVAMYFDCHNAGASMYQCYGVSEPFHWSTVSPNAARNTLIKAEGPFMGHAPNAYNQISSFIEFRIKHNYSGVAQVLQFRFKTGMTNMTQASGRRGNLYVYALA